MYVTETLDGWVKACGLYCKRTLFESRLKKTAEIKHEK